MIQSEAEGIKNEIKIKENLQRKDKQQGQNIKKKRPMKINE